MILVRRSVVVLAVIVLAAVVLDALKAVRPALVLDGVPSVGAELCEVPADDAEGDGMRAGMLRGTSALRAPIEGSSTRSL